jgi:ATP-dependent helicase/nuclease subunit B
MSFLGQLAQELIGRYGADAEGLQIILPGKRARLFLYQEWASEAGSPVWAPSVSTMEEFIFGALGLEEADELTLSLKLWDICSSTPDFDITFDQFSGWVQVILRDFNDVDLFLADAGQVFGNLKDAGELNLWVPGEKRVLSDFEIQYLAFYEHLLPWYLQLRQHLLTEKKAYQGQAFRQLAEAPDLLHEYFSGKTLVFAGFNAFTPAEEKIIGVLEKSGSAMLRWDADDWYLEDPLQEAGTFIRKYRERNPDREFRWTGRRLETEAKEIRVFGVHGLRAQAKLAGNLLASADENSTHTAVVLPDENLLLPLLNSMPPNIHRFNVTMGMPFNHTLAWSWLNLLMNLFHPGGLKSGQWLIVNRLIPVVRHPWFLFLVQRDLSREEGSRPVVPLPPKKFCTFGEIADLYTEAFPQSESIIGQLFAPVQHSGILLSRMQMTLHQLLSQGSFANRPFDHGAALEALGILKKISEMLKTKASEEQSFSMLRFILSRLLSGASIPFTGEPLEGVQILGLLETRNLDFRHVILLSANEKILPSGRKPATIIPADIRSFHGLPGVQHQDAIFAYHFYHLLQRAEKIDFIYNTDLASDFSGEMSRFIRQIENELVPANPLIRYSHLRVPEEIRRSEADVPIEIRKTPEVLEGLMKMLKERPLSASQISRYIRCPLMFYYSYVAGISEPDSFEETLDFMELGTLVHHALESIYRPDNTNDHPSSGDQKPSGYLLDEDFLKRASTESGSLVLRELREQLGGIREITGKNLIIAEVATFMVKNFIDNELKLVKDHRIEILEVEKLLKGTLQVDGMHVDFIGFADRIDRFDGLVRILDYKTGKVQTSDVKPDAIEPLFTEPACEKSFQLMLYAWMYYRQEHPGKLSTGIFTLKSPATFLIELGLLKDISSEKMEELIRKFEGNLENLIHEILDPSTAFRQTEDHEPCKNCPYHDMCLTEIS